MTNELQRHLIETGTNNLYCLSVHPGGVSTELSRGNSYCILLHNSDAYFLCSGPIESWPGIAALFSFTNRLLLTPEQGALTQLYAATALEVEEKDMKSVIPSITFFVLTEANISALQSWLLGPYCKAKIIE